MSVRRHFWHLGQYSKEIELLYGSALSKHDKEQHKSIAEIRSKIQLTIVPEIQKIMREVKSEDLQSLLQTNKYLQKIHSSHQPAGVSTINFLTLLRTPHTELSAFIVPPNSKLPLHDHPDMNVCCQVLDGVLCEYSANWILTSSKSSSSSSSSLDEEVKSQKKIGGKVICVSRGEVSAANDTKLIQSYKNEGGVLHEFWTNENIGAIFLDFFTPTYYSEVDAGDSLTVQRSCTYYELFSSSSHRESEGNTNNNSKSIVREQKVGDISECVPMKNEPQLNMQDLFAEMIAMKAKTTQKA